MTAETYSLKDVSAINCRSLMMTGNYSPELSHFLSGKIANSLPNVKLKNFPTGHMGPVSHSGLIHSVISDFICKS